jgi:RNA exonuclease 4
MVGVGHQGDDSILARISLVNHFGNCIYDKYVKPTEKVVDYRTHVSGIRPKDIENGEDFKTVQKEVSDILQGRILVGHSLKHDLKVLFLNHPKRDVRDTSVYKPFRAAFGGRTPSLKNLSARMLGVTVQEGEHSSVQDAQATIRLYTMFRKEWEKSIGEKRANKMGGGGGGGKGKFNPNVNPNISLKKSPSNKEGATEKKEGAPSEKKPPIYVDSDDDSD